jgi:RNA 2',3'-cyclic 3'-phosphodiesterase
MRLFIAIAPPPEVLEELEATVAPLRPAWPALRWTGTQAWHVTLAFLGEVREDTTAALEPRLERAAHRHPSLSLSFAGGGAFPAPGRARVLWTGIHGDRGALEALARSVAAGARRAGAPPPDEGRRFQPHLTLARCREPANVGPLVEVLAGYAGSPWAAAEIHLIRSHLGGAAPRYETVATWPLRPRLSGSSPPLSPNFGHWALFQQRAASDVLRHAARVSCTRDVQHRSPVTPDGRARTAGQAAADLAVEPVPLPLLHGDVAGERLQQLDVAFGVADLLPVKMPDVRDREQPARLDLGGVLFQLTRAGPGVIGWQAFVDLFVDVLDPAEEGVASFGEHVGCAPAHSDTESPVLAGSRG